MHENYNQINFNSICYYFNGNPMKFSDIDDIWNSFYCNNEEYIPITQSKIINNQNKNCFIHDLLFSNFNQRIIDLQGDQKVLIYKTIFFANTNNQNSDSHGRLISKLDGSLVQYQVHSLDTTINLDEYSAVHSNSELSDSSLNYVKDSTFTGSKGNGPSIRCKKGHIIIKNINISNTQSDYHYSGYVTSSYVNNNSFTYSIISNITSGDGPLRHSNFDGNLDHLIINGVVANESGTSYCIISAYIYSSITIRDCIFSNSDAYRIFETDDSSSLTISDCYINNNKVHEVESGTINLETTNFLELNTSEIGPEIKAYQLTKFAVLKFISITNTLLKGIDENASAIITIESNISFPIAIIIYIDDEIIQVELIPLQYGINLYNINITIPSRLDIGTHNLTAKIQGYNENESRSVAYGFKLIDPVEISIIYSKYNKRRITIFGAIDVKENDLVKELEVALDNSTNFIRVDEFTIGKNNEQLFNFNFEFPSDFTKGNHCIQMNAVNNSRIIGTIKYDFIFDPDRLSTNRPVIPKFRKRR
ncbi:hypothetical protein TVAG_349480 [Trichomonas vaginalis G3]|uniref:Right handed beta helix domain-containing protein n=1 Tax=Trichomonas vaginalis (strain ATCC PRA-98 / G3) TaxID=412133 RepID=A2EMM5_TRIV3|nr:pectin lyase-like family [Trichomonas vaginalis G3]EAY06095.1 hypothetical protein TVAG_349480 [Trichomonas vaginalis G3]KAI5497146.1 pectin lyase-like family [Trichomonas vaginalis G3]|eukprot:XP_001318318.1 hypothetical protein [Trichomonas vaginalis G3]